MHLSETAVSISKDVIKALTRMESWRLYRAIVANLPYSVFLYSSIGKVYPQNTVVQLSSRFWSHGQCIPKALGSTIVHRNNHKL